MSVFQDHRVRRRQNSVLLVAAMLLPITALQLTGGSIRHLVDVRFHWTPLMLGALAVAITITTLVPQGSGEVHRWINLATYAAALAVLWRNRPLPGLPTTLIGAGLNVTAITANNGIMPAWRPALDLAKLPPTSPDFLSSAQLATPRLLVLGDVFAVPGWVPFANVFSAGDVLIVIGISFAFLCLGKSRLVPARVLTRCESRIRDHHPCE